MQYSRNIFKFIIFIFLLFFNLKYVILKKYLQIYYFYIFVIFLLNLECVYDSSSNKSLFVFDDIASGQEFDKTLFFALYDEMNQQVLSISDSEFQIKILDLNLFPKNSNFSLKYKRNFFFLKLPRKNHPILYILFTSLIILYG